MTGALKLVALVKEKRRSAVMDNLAARVVALLSLTVASLLVARTGGPPAVGVFVLLRVMPWMVGALISGGLFGAAPYFLSGPDRSNARVRPTLFAIAIASGVAGGLLWVAGSALLAHQFFPNLAPWLVAAAGATVLTQNLESTAKACSQGSSDFVGSNRIIMLEELLFIPAYALLLALGVDGTAALVPALVIGDLCTGIQGWTRLTRKGFFRDERRPSFRIAGRVYRYGVRAQVGSVILLLNARLDFAIVGAFVGPAALGIYAIASRYAELLRLPGLAVNYVLYPAYARDGGALAARKARELLPRVAWIPAAVAVPLGAAATFVLPLVYGDAFRPAIGPAFVLLLGLTGVGVSGVVSAFLYGEGRPGLNSLAMGAGLVVTLTLDILLIPRFGVMGAAVASCVAYLTTTFVLLLCFLMEAHSYEQTPTSPRARTDQPLTEVNR